MAHGHRAIFLAALVGLVAATAAHGVSAAEEITERQRKQGMAKAPALAKSLNLGCTVSDARRLPTAAAQLRAELGAFGGSSSSGARPPGGGGPPPEAGGGGEPGGGAEMGGGGTTGGMGPIQPERYEVSCTEGLGYLITASSSRSQPASASLCVESYATPTSPSTLGDTPASGTAPGGPLIALPPAGPRGGGSGAARGGGPGAPGVGEPEVQCALPGNSPDSQRAAVAALAAKAGVKCEIRAVRGSGRTAKNTVLELGCADGEGFALIGPNPLLPSAEISADSCLDIPSTSPFACALNDREAVLRAVDTLIASERKCQVKAHRYMMSTPNGDRYFEFACADSKQWILQQKSDKSLGGTAPCSDSVAAQLGGCKLTVN